MPQLPLNGSVRKIPVFIFLNIKTLVRGTYPAVQIQSRISVESHFLLIPQSETGIPSQFSAIRGFSHFLVLQTPSGI